MAKNIYSKSFSYESEKNLSFDEGEEEFYKHANEVFHTENQKNQIDDCSIINNENEPYFEDKDDLSLLSGIENTRPSDLKQNDHSDSILIKNLISNDIQQSEKNQRLRCNYLILSKETKEAIYKKINSFEKQDLKEFGKKYGLTKKSLDRILETKGERRFGSGRKERIPELNEFAVDLKRKYPDIKKLEFTKHAKAFIDSIGKSDLNFQFSDGWFNILKKKYGISFRRMKKKRKSSEISRD